MWILSKPNLREVNMIAVHLICDSILTKQIKISDFVVAEDLLTSCSHAGNKYKVHLLGKSKEAEETENIWKRKALQEGLTSKEKEGRT